MNYFPNNITLNTATELQKQFAEQVVLDDKLPMEPQKLGGVITYCRGNEVLVSGAVLDKNNKLLKKKILKEKIVFPEVPTFEGFRMGKTAVQLVNMLETPDVLFVFGHGINHPRRCGFASHVGLALDMPTIAVARDTFTGSVSSAGAKQLVWDDDTLVAEVVRGASPSIPLYISPGHKVTLDTAVALVKRITKRAMPEPLMVAQKELLSKIQNQ
jgi:deoxyribonuclease V